MKRYKKKKDAPLSSFSPSASSSVSIPCLHFAHTEEKRQQRGFGIPPTPTPTLTPLHPDVGHMSRGIQASHSHRPSLPHRQPLHTWKEGSCLCALCFFFFLSFSFPSSLLPPIPRRRRLKGSAGLSGCFARERERERDRARVGAMALDPWQLFPSMFHAHSHSCSPNES